MMRAYTFAEIERMPERPCDEGLRWLRRHWPINVRTWTIAGALRAGCGMDHALWLMAHDAATLPLVVNFARECAVRVGVEAAAPVAAACGARMAAFAALAAVRTGAVWAQAVRAQATEAAEAAVAAIVAAEPATTETAEWADERAWQRARLIEMLEAD